MGSLFEGAAVHDPTHFRRVHLRDVLGGLTRLVEQVGWANVLLEGERAKTVGASNV
jgi:hypothetical protein